ANPAEFLRSQEFGVIRAGKRADLLLVKADPLKDVKNVRRLAGVMVRGKWISEAEIGERLNKLAGSNAR
ncbi:MAG TPA: amidohydrolase family protein, partial [Blastocatellia bacterium]